MQEKYEVVEIKWEDSAGVHGWEEIEEVLKKETVYVTSVGILLASEEDKIVICNSVDPQNENSCGALIIPRPAVKMTRTLGTVLP